MKYIMIASILVLTLFTSCSESEREKQNNVIIEMENNLKNDSSVVLNKNITLDLSRKYSQFATDFPKDTLAPLYLFEAGRMTMNLNMGSKAIGYFNRILNGYPDFEKIPTTVFLKAYIFENLLGDDNKAKETYNQFINNYPDHILYKDAITSVANIGKSLEQIIKEFEEKNKRDSIN